MKHVHTLQKSFWILLGLMCLNMALYAQSNITLPAACNTCGSTTSPSTNGTAVVSAYGNLGGNGSVLLIVRSYYLTSTTSLSRVGLLLMLLAYTIYL